MKSLEERAIESMAGKDYSEMVTMPKQLMKDLLDGILKIEELVIIVNEQRSRAVDAESKLEQMRDHINNLLRFVPPQTRDPLVILHNDAVDALLDMNLPDREITQ